MDRPVRKKPNKMRIESNWIKLIFPIAIILSINEAGIIDDTSDSRQNISPNTTT